MARVTVFKYDIISVVHVPAYAGNHFSILFCNLHRVKLERKEEIAEIVYDMVCGSAGDTAIRDKLIEVMYENEQLKAENSKLRELLDKAYDFMKQFVVDGRNLLGKFLESIEQVVKKVRIGLKR